jgi:GAF domain-containing protein
MGEVGAEDARPTEVAVNTAPEGSGAHDAARPDAGLPDTSRPRTPAPAPKDGPVDRASARLPASEMPPNATEYAVPPAENRLQYLEELVAASHAINAILEPAKVAEVLALRAAKILRLAAVVVLSADEQERITVLSAPHVPPAFVAAHEGAAEDSIVGRALREARPFATWDLRQATDARLAAAAREAFMVSGVCAPMFFGGKAVGALCVYTQDARRFSEDELRILSLLAAQGGIALTNARAYRELRIQAAEVRTGFQRVGEALSASLDIGETLHLIVQLAVDITPADAGAIFLLQEPHEGDGMRLAGMRGLEARSVRRFRLMPVSTIARRALDEHRIVYVPDTRRVSEVAFPALRLNLNETAETRSVLCVPLLAGDRPLGVLEHYSAAPNAFSQRDIQLLGTFAHQATVAIERAQLYAQERNIAQTLQRCFLPELPEAIHGFQIGRIYAPGSLIGDVGGDSYDVFTLPDGRIATLIADVAGQGTHAATLAIMVKYTVRAYALEDPHPSSVLRRLNEAVRLQTEDSTFVTVTYGLLDPVKRTAALATAAHPPPLLWCAKTRQCHEIATPPGLICGFLPDQDYGTIEVSLGSGDTLVFYTDGVIEARRGKTMFKQERLEKVIRENADLSAQEIAGAVYVAVTEFVDGERTDDIALLTLRVE